MGEAFILTENMVTDSLRYKPCKGESAEAASVEEQTFSTQEKTTKVKSMSGRGKVTQRTFLEELSPEQQENFFRELDSALNFYLTLERPVYLEGFGILIPSQKKVSRSTFEGTYGTLHNEVVIVAQFEKCNDLAPRQREQLRNLVETKEIAQRLNSRLHIGEGALETIPHNSAYAQDSDQLRNTQRMVRAAVEFIKHETVAQGVFRGLPLIGTFLSLHNRQGNNFSEWFAGADIFLNAKVVQTVRSEQPLNYERPILANAWESLEAYCGRSLKTFKIDLARELSALGFQFSPHDASAEIPLERYVDVACFELPSQHQGNSTHRNEKPIQKLLFCTEGLRHYGIAKSKQSAPGSEIVFQLDRTTAHFPVSEEQAQVIACRVLTLAWILQHGSKTCCLKPGRGLTSEFNLLPAPLSMEIKSILAVPFNLQRSEQLCETGAFSYVNIIAIPEAEALLSQKIGFDGLLGCLRHRKLDQYTSVSRPSLVQRAEFPGKPTLFGSALQADEQSQPSIEQAEIEAQVSFG